MLRLGAETSRQHGKYCGNWNDHGDHCQHPLKVLLDKVISVGVLHDVAPMNANAISMVEVYAGKVD